MNEPQTLESSLIVEQRTEPYEPALFELGATEGPYKRIRALRQDKGIYLADHDKQTVVLKAQPTLKMFGKDYGASALLYEATLLEQCAGDGVCPVIDLTTLRDRLVLVTPYLGSKQLESIRNERETNLALEKLATTLARMHDDCDTIHGDIKNENIAYVDDEPVLFDLGIGRTMGSPAPPFFDPDLIIGTPHILAPENYDGQYNRKSDVFQFALLWARLVLKNEPFGIIPVNNTCVPAFNKIRHESAWFEPYGELGTLMQRALSLETDQRPHMRDIRDAFKTYSTQHPPQSVRSSESYRPPWLSSLAK